MAKKMNSFAADFEGINKSADDRVLEMLRNADHVPTEVKQPLPEKEPKKAVTSSDSNTTQLTPVGERTEVRRKKEKPRPRVEWGKPVAHFNTRIPVQMADLLDDLVYKLRKKGDHKTKQDLAHEALKDLLRKHSIC